MLCLFQIDFEYLSPCLIKHFAVVHKFLLIQYKSQAYKCSYHSSYHSKCNNIHLNNKKRTAKKEERLL